MISQHQYIYIYFQISPTVRNEYGKQHCLLAFKCSFRFGYYLGSKFLWHFILFFCLLCIKSLRFSPPLLLLLLLNNQKKKRRKIYVNTVSVSVSNLNWLTFLWISYVVGIAKIFLSQQTTWLKKLKIFVQIGYPNKYIIRVLKINANLHIWIL